MTTVLVLNGPNLGRLGRREPEVYGATTHEDLVGLIEAEAAGCTVVDGLGMLLHQAAPGFERWFGQRPEVDEDTRQAVLSA